jgi:hypothetical protein
MLGQQIDNTQIENGTAEWQIEYRKQWPEHSAGIPGLEHARIANNVTFLLGHHGSTVPRSAMSSPRYLERLHHDSRMFG